MPSQQHRIAIHTLGTLRVEVDGVEQPALLKQRTRLSVLVVLAVEREITRDALVQLLWPDQQSEQARHTLSQNLSELRRTFGHDWVNLADQLTLSKDVYVDAHEFEHAAQLRDFAQATSLYNGHFLAAGFVPATNGSSPVMMSAVWVACVPEPTPRFTSGAGIPNSWKKISDMLAS